MDLGSRLLDIHQAIQTAITRARAGGEVNATAIHLDVQLLIKDLNKNKPKNSENYEKTVKSILSDLDVLTDILKKQTGELSEKMRAIQAEKRTLNTYKPVKNGGGV